MPDKKKTFSVIVDESILKLIDKEASKRKRSRNYLVNEAISELIKKFIKQ